MYVQTVFHSIIVIFRYDSSISDELLHISHDFIYHWYMECLDTTDRQFNIAGITLTRYGTR